MRLLYILMAALATLSVYQVPVTASIGSVALTGGMSLGLLHLVSADQTISDQSRFLRGNNIAEGGKEERGFAENLVYKMLRTNSFSALKKVNNLATQKRISAIADDYLASLFSVVNKANMKTDDLAIHMKKIGADDKSIGTAVEKYTTYLKELGKNHAG
ncbi:Secreted RxLR effector peptide protein [Phytophthora palmivora]|uniref:RxLR effector protein n=1 Tax=Phytophthora palmivora TaxID=4796 RepID=A0A2P4YG87_9STRA|nr:Secreted RxLR effector peptide protein [Phytophthora palmivora]